MAASPWPRVGAPRLPFILMGVALLLTAPPLAVAELDDGASIYPGRPAFTIPPDIGPVGFVEVAAGAAARRNAAAFPLGVKAAFTRALELQLAIDTAVMEQVGTGWTREAGAMGAWLQWQPLRTEEGVRWAAFAGAIAEPFEGERSPTWNLGVAIGQPVGDLRWDANLSAANARSEPDGGRYWTVSASAMLSLRIGDFVLLLDGATTHDLASGGWNHRALGGVGYCVGPRLVIDAAVELPLRAPAGRDDPTAHLGVSALVGLP